LIGIELVSLDQGLASTALNLRPELNRNSGLVHGGAIASLIDTAAAFSAMTLLSEDEETTTIDLTIHFLRPLTEGRALARARVVRGGRRIIVVSVEVSDETQVIVATAVTSYLRMTRNQPVDFVNSSGQTG
jgi:uncharacterized protein (TIGR00369 family)